MRRLGLPSIALPPLMGTFTTVSCVDELIPINETFNQIMGACAIHYTLNGEADITVDGRAMTHRPGSLFAVIPGVELTERVTKPWHVRYVMLNGPWCSPLVTALTDKGGAVMLDRPPKPWITALNTAVDAGITGETGAT
jgi:AraC-like ligand binding domain